MRLMLDDQRDSGGIAQVSESRDRRIQRTHFPLDAHHTGYGGEGFFRKRIARVVGRPANLRQDIQTSRTHYGVFRATPFHSLVEDFA